MNIWLVTIGEPLPLNADVRKLRTGMLADRLAENGHVVRWWVSAFEHQRKVMLFDKDEEVPLSDNLTLQVMRGSGYRKNISLSRYLDHRIIAKKFRIQSRKKLRPDIIVASVPCHHLAYETVRYARSMNVPVFADVRDLWPDIFLDNIHHVFFKKIGRIFLRNDFARLRFLLRNANALLAISNGCLQWGLDNAGRPPNKWDRVFFLGYKESHMSPAHGNGTLLPDWLRGKDDKKILVFIGTFGFSYELILILQAARRIEAAGQNNICFVIAGTGEQAEAVQREARGLSNVILPGWIGSNEIRMLLSRGYAGLLSCRSIEDALPNKTFEYLSAGLPVISSLEGEMADMIERFKLGINYRPGDLEGLCHAIDTLVGDTRLREEMSANALDFFRKHGDADTIYTEFAKHIEEFMRDH